MENFTVLEWGEAEGFEFILILCWLHTHTHTHDFILQLYIVVIFLLNRKSRKPKKATHVGPKAGTHIYVTRVFQIVTLYTSFIPWMQLWDVKNHQGIWGQKPWVQVQPLLLYLVFHVWPRTYVLNSHNFGLFGCKLWYPHLPPRAVVRRKQDNRCDLAL